MQFLNTHTRGLKALSRNTVVHFEMVWEQKEEVGLWFTCSRFPEERTLQAICHRGAGQGCKEKARQILNSQTFVHEQYHINRKDRN